MSFRAEWRRYPLAGDDQNEVVLKTLVILAVLLASMLVDIAIGYYGLQAFQTDRKTTTITSPMERRPASYRPRTSNP